MSAKRKIAFDISASQFQWASSFLGVVLIIYIVFQAILTPIDLTNVNFFDFSYQPAKIFGLVVGIIAGGMFFSRFVRQGVTRKSTFTGNMLAAGLLSLFLLIIISFITVLEVTLFESAGTITGFLPSVLLMALHVFIYYMAGWLITTGYLRFGGLGMAAYIILALLITMVTDMIGETPEENTLSHLLDFPIGDIFSYALTLILLLILTAILIWVGRKTTAHTPIKLK